MSAQQPPDGPGDNGGIAELDTLVGDPTQTGAMVHAAIELKAPATIPLTFDERYRFERPLGRGGMGEVKLYWDQQIGRPVAVKTIRADRETTTDLETRFLREARTQGQLEHPAIVPVHELGRLPDGSAFFAMKEVAGSTLTQTLREMKADGSDAPECYRRRLLNAFSRLCLAIDYAHQRGVSHRDLKPDNIMLGDFGEVWVLDWGMASSSGPSGTGVISGDDEKLTGYGDVFGTPGYAAPEQMNLVEGDVGAPADIYALGVLLFEVLTFEKLHEGANFRALAWSTSTGGKLAQGEIAFEVPAELRALIERCLVSDPTERTITPRELYDAVEAFQDGERNLALRRQLAEEQLDVARTAVDAVAASDGLHERKEALAALGKRLVGLHLLRENPAGPLPAFPADGDALVESPRYAPPTSENAAPNTDPVPGRVWINGRQYFAGVRRTTWETTIGGYRVLDKWLKDRKGRALSFDDIQTYRRIVGALEETADVAAAIDDAIERAGGWPFGG